MYGWICMNIMDNYRQVPQSSGVTILRQTILMGGEGISLCQSCISYTVIGFVSLSLN
jgi:hypothetical protein